MQGIEELSKRVAALLTPDDARALLKRKVGSEVGFLDQLAGANGMSHALTCRALAASYGFDILFDRDMKRAILARVPITVIDEIWEAVQLENDGTVPPAEKKRARLLELQVQRGSYRARRLCEALELPYDCAGDASHGRSSPIDFFAPQIDLPPLHEYQLELASRIRVELLEVSGDRRAMLALPTGGGKTRVVLETLLNWNPILSGAGTILWVAQHEELCEQAIECVSQVWASEKRPGNRSIKVQRVWGGKSDEVDWSADVVVGIPESLSPRILDDHASAKHRLRAIVIDEAHLAISPIYSTIFQLAGRASVAVLGVSATPAKTRDPSGVLQQCFEKRLLRAPSLDPLPYVALLKQGVLSEIHFEAIDSGVKVEMTDDERESLRESSGDFSSAMLAKLGKSSARNRVIVDRLKRLPTGMPTLCFASTVPSAHALSAAMTIIGRESAVIDAATPPALRKRILADFRSGEIQFLFNYEVLAMGFDAPSIACLLIARPTRSPVLLEQMIGRGLRGPKNGGTPTCTLLWIEDDFANADELQPQSYQRFADLWKAQHG